MPSFDVVSELNAHEVTNAVDQANRELDQRFDFKDTGARFELKEFLVTLHAQVEFQLKQMLEILKLRLSKRGIDIACIEVKDPTDQPRRRHSGGGAEAGHRPGNRQEGDAHHQGFEAQGAGGACRATRCASRASSATICRRRCSCCARSKIEVPLQFNNFRD